MVNEQSDEDDGKINSTIEDFKSLDEKCRTVNSNISDILKNVEEKYQTINSILNEVNDSKEEIDSKKDEFNKEYDALLADLEQSKIKVQNILDRLDTQYNDFKKISEQYINTIHEKHDEFINDLGNKSQEIKRIYGKIIDLEEHHFDSNSDTFVSIISDIDEKYKKIKSFYSELFGENKKVTTPIASHEYNCLPNDYKEKVNNTFYKVTYEKTPSIKDDVDNLINDFNCYIEEEKKYAADFKINNQKHYQELYARIESLLPNATAAGLSEAFAIAYKDAEKKIFWWKIVYGVCLLLVVAFSIFLLFFHFINFSTIDSISQILIQILKMFGLEFPLIWFAITANKKVIQYTRLAEEYRHKWVIMRVFDGMKKAIENESVNENQKNHMNDFYNSVISLLSLNPTANFDKNIHTDSPTEHVMSMLKKYDSEKDQNK